MLQDVVCVDYGSVWVEKRKRMQNTQNSNKYGVGHGLNRLTSLLSIACDLVCQFPLLKTILSAIDRCDVSNSTSVRSRYWSLHWCCYSHPDVVRLESIPTFRIVSTNKFNCTQIEIFMHLADLPFLLRDSQKWGGQWLIDAQNRFGQIPKSKSILCISMRMNANTVLARPLTHD